MHKKKLLFVLPSNTIGGAERATYNILRNITQIEPILFTHDALKPLFADLGINIYFFEDFGCHGIGPTLRNILSYLTAIKKAVQLDNPSIIFGMMHHASLYVTLLKDLHYCKAKTVSSARGHATAYFKATPGRNYRAKLILHYYSRRANSIIVPSECIKEDLIAHFGARGERVIVIPNGIDLNWVKSLAREDIEITKDCPWIITSCRLDPGKNLYLLFDAFSDVIKNTKCKLLVLGDGILREPLNQWIREKGYNEDILLLGFQKNPFKYISKSDVFVLSSLYEGFPNVIVEAMALGIPIISTDCPSGPREIIGHEGNGFLVPIGDHKKMADHILRILNNRTLREKLSKAGMRRAEFFPALKMAQRYEEYFIQLADSE